MTNSDAAELPDGWSLVPIGELCDLNPKHESLIRDDLPVSFVPMAAVSDAEGKITQAEVRAFGEVRKGYTHFSDGDVIFAKITPCMENGKAASVRQLMNGIGCGTTEFFVFRSRGAIDQDYLFYFIRQESFRRAARATMQSGVGQARVPKEFVLEAEIPLPPLNEQRRIVAKIEALTARSRKAREALEAIGPLLEQYRQSVLASAFRGDLTADWREQHADGEPGSALLDRIRQNRRRQWEFDFPRKKYPEPEPIDDSDLPDLPDGWAYAQADEVVAPGTVISYGIVLPGNPLKDGVPYIRGQDIEHGRILVDQLLKTSREIAAKHDRTSLLKGDVLLCIIRHLKVAIVPEGLDGANLTQGTVRMRPSDVISGPYLAAYLESPAAQGWMKERYFGMAMPRINVEDARAIPVPVAPIEEQREITRRLGEYEGRRKLVLAEARAALGGAVQLDQSILAKAFRGELVPQDPNDEPAAALLERLRAERNGHDNGKPRTTNRKPRRRPAP